MDSRLGWRIADAISAEVGFAFQAIIPRHELDGIARRIIRNGGGYCSALSGPGVRLLAGTRPCDGATSVARRTVRAIVETMLVEQDGQLHGTWGRIAARVESEEDPFPDALTRRSAE
jgi:hypothetical protein